MLVSQRDTCMNKTFQSVRPGIHGGKQGIHKEDQWSQTLDHQKAKFERLFMKNKGGHSNSENLNMYRYMYHSGKNFNSRQIDTTTTAPSTTLKWVINISSTPITEVQKQLLAHGPNFAISPWTPPTGETSQQLNKPDQVLPRGRQRNCLQRWRLL